TPGHCGVRCHRPATERRVGVAAPAGATIGSTAGPASASTLSGAVPFPPALSPGQLRTPGALAGRFLPLGLDEHAASDRRRTSHPRSLGRSAALSLLSTLSEQ